MDFTQRFKKFDGEQIPNIIDYISDYVTKDPYATISVGCDSVQRRHKTVFSVTVMFCNEMLRNGSHLVFFRENSYKIRDNFERLCKEAYLLQEVGEFLDNSLKGIYERKDLSLDSRKRYKFHLAKCGGEYPHLPLFLEEQVTNRLELTSMEVSTDYKLVDLHIDFNPKDQFKNKSFLSYKSFVPWLRGMNFRVWAKPKSFAASCAADLLLQNQ